jgi:two-component system response regulator CpxR
MAVEKVLIIDDDVGLCALLTERLRCEGFAVETVNDGLLGLERALSREHSLAVLDLMLPGLGGLEVLKRLRPQSRIPVLILTARGEDVDRILGFEMGADDYLPKPFNPRELIVRIRAILRRVNSPTVSDGPLVLGSLRADPSTREAWAGRVPLDLTSVEFSLLEMFLRNAGRILSRELLTETVLGRKSTPFDRAIDVHVSNLRRKLASAEEDECIKAIRGNGYLFAARATQA